MAAGCIYGHCRSITVQRCLILVFGKVTQSLAAVQRNAGHKSKYKQETAIRGNSLLYE